MHGVIWWIGSKTRLMRFILPYLTVPHTTYCSVFGGGASDLFAKKRVPTEVYNDIDPDLIALFQTLQDSHTCQQLFEELALTPYSRHARAACHLTASNLEVLERARRLFVRSRMGFGAKLDHSSWGYTTQTVSNSMANVVHSYVMALNRLSVVQRRLQQVQIRQEDWQVILDQYDTKETLFYLDPPYVPDERRGGGYRFELTLEDHHRLVDRLLRLRGRVALSGYPNVVYTRLEDAGWQRTDLDVVCKLVGYTTGTGKDLVVEEDSDRRRTEAIWTNYRK